MARPLTFSPDEDAIIMATAGLSAEETNSKLVRAGYDPREKQTIFNRRSYLARRPPKPSELLEVRERLQKEVEAAQAALREVNEELQRLLSQTADEVREELKE